MMLVALSRHVWAKFSIGGRVVTLVDAPPLKAVMSVALEFLNQSCSGAKHSQWSLCGGGEDWYI